MSAFSFDARRESFAKAQNRLADCFSRHVVPDCQQLHSRFRIRYRFCGLGFSLL